MSSTNELFGEIFKWIRRFFIVTKGLVILYLSITFVYRYYKTFKTVWKFEILIFVGVIILDMALILFEVWHSLNVIFAVFMLNCFMKMNTAFYL